MNCGQQMEHSEKKSNMSKRTDQEVHEANKKAVEENRCCDFQTTSNTGDAARTMKEIMKTNKANLGMWSWLYAEKYDEASWFRARAEYLQQKVWELEAKLNKEHEDEESEDFDWECEYCEKGGHEDQEGAVVKSANANGDWSEIVGWCNKSHHEKWLKRQERMGEEVPEHLM